ncbi:MAG TPA: MaoC family dehydratase [Actinomycetota bacterium]|nr:MaoC family dehydratase [Actinomycetota bacterium]
MGLLEELKALEGQELGVGDWMEVTQERIDAFADATDDHQWIHVDPDKAASGPFGTTIAHGYLTLSLIPALGKGIELPISTVPKMGINYGLNRVRFPSPVPSGSKVRARRVLKEATGFEGGVQLVVEVTVEIDGKDKPACVAETVSRLYT